MPVSLIQLLQFSGVIVVNACSSNISISVVGSSSSCWSSSLTLENADSIGFKSGESVRGRIVHYIRTQLLGSLMLSVSCGEWHNCP